MNKYEQALINNASKLDAVTDACGEITKLATVIVEDNSKVATIALLRKISEAVDNPKHKIEAKRAAHVVNSSLIEFYGYSTIQRICKPTEESDVDARTLQDLLDELNALVGSLNPLPPDILTFASVMFPSLFFFILCIL